MVFPYNRLKQSFGAVGLRSESVSNISGAGLKQMRVLVFIERECQHGLKILLHVRQPIVVPARFT